MQFNRECKIWKAASKEAGRYAMHRVMLTAVKPKMVEGKVGKGADGQDVKGDPYALPGEFTAELVATNGKILAVVPCEVGSKGGDGPDALEPADSEGLVDQDALKRAVKVKGRGEALLHCLQDRLRTLDGLESPRMNDGEFPRYQAVVPKPSSWSNPVRLAFNPRLLLDLAEAIGAAGTDAPCVVLEFEYPPKDPKCPGPVLVHPGAPREGKPYGVLMPITVGS